MGEQVTGGTSTDAVVVSEAYAAARDLLRAAEEDAARTRADADRYRRQREQEAELLVAKARRLLTLAEARAVHIAAPPAPEVAAAAPLGIVAPDVGAPPGADAVVLDLDAPPPIAPAPRIANELDALLAAAIGNALEKALPPD